ncbi:S9 family peptidase [Solimonas terrae]|uniref:Prolyl oligopeptidase family serine peptidase n=1 Tax=Solimonas terrae TaxID=1396819 RepID=A0A6M2BMB1_9GAMM|nr:DPP IV N-terminal domain-containing protein [Solimonas terrae]NGY03285.1 prolyl oligopeptidase family serine peptidase [Solimonas terrae]
MSAAVLEAYRDLPKLVRDANLIPAWSSDGKTLGFVAGAPDARQAWRVDLTSGDKTPLLDVQRVRDALKAATGVTPPGAGLPFEAFGFVGPDMIAFAIGADRFMLDLNRFLVIRPPAPNMIDTMFGQSAEARMTPRTFKRSLPMVGQVDAYEVMSPDGRNLLSIQDYNVSLRSAYDGRTQALTTDGTREVEWTIDWAFPGMPPVTNWSPQGTHVAAYMVDNRGVPEVLSMHNLGNFEHSSRYYFPKAGGVLESHRLFVLDVMGNPPVEIQLGDTRDHYPVFVGWLPDGSELVVLQMSRDCRRIDVFAASAITGAVRKLFSEEGKTFVRIHHDIYFNRKLGCSLTPDGRHLLWQSERDGWNHLYQYDLDGRLEAQLTSGDWPVTAVERVIGGHVYFSAHCDRKRPYDLHLCRVALGGGTVEQLTEGEGVHRVSFAPNGETFLDTYSSVSAPPVTALRRVDGSVLNAELLRADITPLVDVGYTASEEFCVKAADGETELWGVMYKPHDFDAGKRYPVIEWIYGGPQITIAEHGFPALPGRANIGMRLAQLGCIAIMLDARGTPERNKAFHDTAAEDFQGTVTADHAAALRQLAERHAYIDLDRVGVTGGSWGAYFGFRCLIDQPEVYKAATVFAPGFDPLSCVLYECYLGFPQTNPDGYRKADIFAMAPRLDRPLMIAGGTADHATWPDAIKMTEALIRAGKDHEFVVLPDQVHGFGSVHQDYLDNKQAAFFRRHLGF